MKKQTTIATFAGYPPVWLMLLLPVLLLLAIRSCPRSQALQVRDYSPRATLPQQPKGGDSGAVDVTVLTLAQSPKYVRQMIRYLRSVRHLNPPKGYKGGREFKNLEGRLPKGKRYYEYDLHPAVRGTSRGAERLVTDQEKSVFYYTRNHYNSFIKIE